MYSQRQDVTFWISLQNKIVNLFFCSNLSQNEVVEKREVVKQKLY